MWLRKRTEDAQLDRELRYHFDSLVRDSIAAGVPPDEARRRAWLEFGGLALPPEKRIWTAKPISSTIQK
jgi:hypothetical protein